MVEGRLVTGQGHFPCDEDHAVYKECVDICEHSEDYPLGLVAKVIEKEGARREIQPHSPRQVKLEYYSLQIQT